MQRLPGLVLLFVLVAVSGFLIATAGDPHRADPGLRVDANRGDGDAAKDDAGPLPLDDDSSERAVVPEEVLPEVVVPRRLEDEQVGSGSGVLALVVAADDVLGVRATLVRGTASFMATAPLVPDSTWRTLEPAAAGLASTEFERLDAGAWTVLVDSPAFGQRRALARIRPGEERAEVRVTVGDAVLFGTVWDGEGRPVEGATVDLSLEGQITPTRTLVQTGADGRYRAEGLTAGAGWATFTAEDGDRIASDPFHLEPTEEQQLDVGSPAGDSTLRLRIVDATGAPVWKGKLEAIPFEGSDVTRHGDLDDQGRGELALPAGTYVLRYWGPDGEHVWRDKVEVFGRGESERELQLEGARVSGRLVDRRGDEAPWTGGTGQRVVLRAGPARGDRVVHGTRPRGDGRFRFDGVAAGVYYLTMPRGLRLDSVRVVVDEGASAVDVDVQVRGGR